MIFETVILLQSSGMGGKLGTIIFSADWFAKLIFLLLLFFSIFSWGVIINRLRVFGRVKRESKQFLHTYSQKRQLSETYPVVTTLSTTPLSQIFSQGYKRMSYMAKNGGELFKSGNPEVALTTEALEDIKAVLQQVSSEETQKLEKGVAFLATTATVAPFLGLLGTVWGIMISFQEIGMRGSASLAVVAPGIATALVATIFGLSAAIPAVVAYNYCNRRIRNFEVMQENFASQLLTDIKREILL